MTRWTIYIWLLILLLVGFWLRLTFAVGNLYYIDEFFSMLAATMVAQKGWPVLPSGLFYDHGLLYTLLAGGFVALTGFSEQMARWPVVVVSVLTIAVYYQVARRLFDSPLTGIIAAALVTVDVLLIKWGGWARMYTLAHLFVLLSLGGVWLTCFKQPHARGRYLVVLFLAGMLFSHTLTFLLLPSLALVTGVFTRLYRREWLQNRHTWIQAGVLAVIVAVALWVVSLGHVSTTVSVQIQDSEGYFSLNLPPDLSLFDFFVSADYWWLTGLIGVGAILVGMRFARRTAAFADMAFVFVASVPLITILAVVLFLSDEWQQTRYLFFWALPMVILLSAESLARVLRLVSLLLRNHGSPRWEPVLIPVAVAVVAVVGGRPAWEWATVRETGDYRMAYDYVDEHRHPSDRIMSEQPAVAYLYLQQNDYYANQVSAKVLASESDEMSPLDRYTGSPLVDSVAALNAALDSGERVWLVVGDKHLNRYYEPLFQQQIFAQMDLQYRTGSKYVFLSRADSVPLAADPAVRLDVNFNQAIVLGGYDFHLNANQSATLALYWHFIGDPPTQAFKVFVQLRNRDNQTVAQADHFFLQGVFDGRQWQELRQSGEWLRNAAHLALPPLPAEAGPYRIYVGFYDPVTFERVPIVGDTSGEHAAIISLDEVLSTLAARSN